MQEMLVKSFGERLKACKINIPVLARAIGVHLSELENAMHYNNPSDDMLQKLAEVSAADRWFGGEKLTVGMMRWWVFVYNNTPADKRETTIYRDWEEQPVAREVPSDFGIFATWALSTPFTFQAFKTAFPNNDNETAAITLNALQLACNRELVDGKQTQVWRWNPLNIPKAIGGVPHTPLVSRTNEDIGTSTHKRKVAKAKEVLKDCVAVTIEGFAKLLQGKVPRSSSGLQVVRNVLADAGWTFDSSKKYWVKSPT